MGESPLISVNELAKLLENDKSVKLVHCGLMTAGPDWIPGSVSTPLFTMAILIDSNPQSVQDFMNPFVEFLGKSGIKRSDKVVVYEEGFDKTSAIACRAYTILTYLGLEGVRFLDGGLADWRKHNLPVTTEETKVEPCTFEPAVNGDVFIDREQMLKGLNDKSVYILDDRDKAEWIGESSSPLGPDYCPRKGRMVGAHWIEWYDLWKVGEDGIARFKSKEDIKKRCLKGGLKDESQRVHIYCFMGIRASNTYLALAHAGFKNLRVYLASWNEWSRNDALPIDDKKLEL